MRGRAVSRRDKPLGRTQKMVLHILAARGDCTVADIEMQGFGLAASSIRGALHTLGMRGLVDATGFDESHRSRARTFGLTDAGAKAEEALLGDDADEIREELE